MVLCWQLEGDTGGEGEGDGEEDDDDCFPSILPDIDREGRVPEVFAHIDEFGMLSSSKASFVSAGGRDLGLGVCLAWPWWALWTECITNPMFRFSTENAQHEGLRGFMIRCKLLDDGTTLCVCVCVCAGLCVHAFK